MITFKKDYPSLKKKKININIKKISNSLLGIETASAENTDNNVDPISLIISVKDPSNKPARGKLLISSWEIFWERLTVSWIKREIIKNKGITITVTIKIKVNEAVDDSCLNIFSNFSYNG